MQKSGGLSRAFIERGLFVAIALIALGTLVNASAFLLDTKMVGNDFKVFWTAAQSSTPYAPNDWPFAYPPTTLLWLQPLALLPMWTAFQLWIVASTAAYAFAVREEVGERWPLAFLLFPTVFSLITGQMSMLVAAMVIASFRSKHTGLILGLAFTIKPQLVFLAPVAFLILRDWRNLAWFFVTVWTVVIMSLNMLGGGVWVEWIQSLPHFGERAKELNVLGGAASPAGFAAWFELNPIPFMVAGAALALLTLFRRFKTAEHKGALLGLCCILASPYALIYDLVIIIPLVVADLLRPSWRTLPSLLAVTVPAQVLGIIGVTISELVRGKPLDGEPCVGRDVGRRVRFNG